MISQWLLPGAVHYFSEVLDMLRQGQNLILPVPATLPEDFAWQLERLLNNEGWQTACFKFDISSSPLDHLFQRLNITEKTIGVPRSVAKLRQGMCPGQVTLVYDVGHESWVAWRDFLIEYEIASRDVSSFDRPLIIVIPSGVPLAEIPTKAAALRVMPWQNVLGELDLRLYVYEALREHNCTDT